MQTLKYVLIGIGVIAIVLFIYTLVAGVKIAGALFSYVIGAIAIIALIILVIYGVRKLFGGRSDSSAD